MFTTSARIQIERPERYAKQLAAHLSHKIQAEELENGWRLTFPNGTATLICEPNQLVMKVAANDAESQERMQFVLDKHLRQFTTKLPDLDIKFE